MTLCVDHNELHLTYLLRNLYKGQETTVRIGHGKTEWFKTGKKYKAVYCDPAYKQSVCVCVCARLLSHVQLFSHSLDGSPPGSSVRGILQARVVERLLRPPPGKGDLPKPGVKPASLTSPALAGRFLTTSAAGEA